MVNEHNSWFVMPLLRAAVNGEALEGRVWAREAQAPEVVRLMRRDLAGKGVVIARRGYLEQPLQEAALDLLTGEAQLALQQLYVRMAR